MNLNRPMVRRAALRVLLPLIAAGGVASCSDLTDLDESAATFISPDRFYQNDAQAAIAVNGVYAPLMGWNGWKQPAQHSVMCDDNEMLCWNWMGGGFSGNIAGQWFAQDNSVWFGDYQIIERANEVIANVAASSGISDGMKTLATGQALFARGYAYFDLVRRFGGVPLRLEPYQPESQLGAKARDPVDVVWRQIAKDLREAAPMLPESYSQPNGQGLPRRASAWGLLAKVYLHMAGAEVANTPLAANKTAYLDSARIAAQAEMADAAVRLEPRYMDLFDPGKQNTSAEILFAVQGSKVNLNGSNVVPMFAPRGDCTIAGGCGQGFVSVREDFYRSFPANDKRVEPNVAIARTWEISSSPIGRVKAIHTDSLSVLQSKGLLVRDQAFRWENWTEGCGAFQQQYDSVTVRSAPNSNDVTTMVVAVARPIYTLKYVDPQQGGSEYSNANNFIIVRHADVLLVFAEAENELNGPTAAAYAAINAVRSRAGVAGLSGLTKEQFRQAVWTERAHELYGEFQARFDLVRQGRYLTEMNKQSTVPDFAGHGVCRPRQSFQLLQPIPQRELAANPLLQQNPGY
jgi:starch-binding outer membrane protein, SusD/RagB family